MLNLGYIGITNVGRVFHNLSTPVLYEQAVRRGEGMVAQSGPLVVRTGHYTGRSANDKFIVREPSSQDKIWWGKNNQGIDAEKFERLEIRLQAYLQGREVFVQDCCACADPKYRLKTRIITEDAWHGMFANAMFIPEHDQKSVTDVRSGWTLIHCPHFHAIPEIDGTRSEVFILLHFGQRIIIIGGTSYAGEIKKSIFSVLNYLLPQQGVLSMHCSANQGRSGDVALFFGLSGTGKTTLSSEADRALIGDDEHGWSDDGVFNFEGGCYAKVIRLSPEAEPQIFQATRRFGTILENVAINQRSRVVDFDDDSLTENTRAAYPISYLPNTVPSGMGGHPRNIIMLTADAFGVLPPIAKLTPTQAMYHFISGFTSKLAGTERGVKEPTATFSACFGAPFMALHPTVYADLLGKKIAQHQVACWMVNTGWSGGPYGIGQRIKIAHSRAVVRAALSGALDKVQYRPDPIFKFAVPETCPDVPREILNPRNTWQDPKAYDRKARELAVLFARNFSDYASLAGAEIRDAGPVTDEKLMAVEI